MLSKKDIEEIQVGQKGLYPWDAELPVVALAPVQKVLMGAKAGQVFRYVQVQGPGSTIGFVVAEGDEAAHYQAKQAFKEVE